MEYELITPRGNAPISGRAETMEKTITIITPEQYAKIQEGEKNGKTE